MKTKARNQWSFGIRHLLIGIAFVSILLAVVVGIRARELSNWDAAPNPEYFVVAVRVDGLNSRPILETLSSRLIKTAPVANTAGEGETQFCGVLGGYERIIRRKYSDRDLAELVTLCRQAASYALKSQKTADRVSLCIIDGQGNRFTAESTSIEDLGKQRDP